MSLLKTIFYSAAAGLPTVFLKRISPVRTLFPYHHTVSNGALLHLKHLYTCKSVQQFTADLDFLLRHFKPVSVTDLIQAVHSNTKLPANAFLLSFDDGFREVHDTVAPILTAKGIPAIFFVNPAFIDNKVLFYRCKISLLIDALIQLTPGNDLLKKSAAILDCRETSVQALSKILKAIRQDEAGKLDVLAETLNVSFDNYLATARPFMTTDQLRTLSKQGFTIGGHSWDHPYYDLLTEEQQVEQTIRSCRYVQENISSGPVVFSFPHTDKHISQSFFDTAGLKEIDLFFGIQNQKQELHNKMLHRFNAERPEYPLNKQVNGLLVYLLLRAIFSRKNVMRKHA